MSRRVCFMILRRIVLTAALAALGSGLCAAPPGSSQGKEAGADTPESAFAGFRDAVAKEDWEAAFRFTTPESRTVMVGSLLAMAHMGALGDDGKAFAARKADVAKLGELITAVDRASRQDQAEAIGKIAALVEDQPAFMKEALALFREQKHENVLNMLGRAQVDRLKVEGDSATAMIRVVTDEGSGTEDIAFKRINGRWYVDKRG